MAVKNRRKRKAIKSQIGRIEKRLEKLEKKRRRFSKYRPLVFFSGVALTYWFGWLPLLIAALTLILESLYYRQYGKAIKRHRIWSELKATQMARMTLDWKNIPEPSNGRASPDHPFEIDLDITGKRSLHHLIDTSISREGSLRLAERLLETDPEPKVVTERQNIIRELAPLSRFRDKLLLSFHLVSKEMLEGKKLLKWLHIEPGSNPLLWILPLSAALAVITPSLFLLYQLGWIPGLWVISFAFYLMLYFKYQGLLQELFHAVMMLDDELGKFKTVLYYLETYRYGKNAGLKSMCAPFLNRDKLPSALLKKIKYLTSAVGSRMNPLMTFFLNIAFPWDFFFAHRITQYREKCARLFPEWIEAWTELETLGSLANFAHLNPDYSFPEFIFEEKGDGRPIFQARELGHPLIPMEQKVCNDFSFQNRGEISVITGPNMAGKSTFLKTVGTNLCLTYAGGPVNAASLSTVFFRLFTCIQIHDSITEGFSFFYAEVKRLRRILESLQGEDSSPLFFFVDEIFRGTNSRERSIGGRSFIRHMAGKYSVGMIATHDLELGKQANRLSSISNHHFQDEVADGKMIFDYKLRPGISTTTNALKIMKMEGLPVEHHE